MNKLSLFSGIGGIDLAAQWAGMTTVAFCEIEPFCQHVLRKHWPGVPIIPDVRNVTREEMYRLDIGTVDIISAGYPCQPFSVAGKREGTDDDRHLWPEVARILDDIRPRWFVGENVAGHISLGLDEVLSDLDNAGYTAQAFVIPACAVGARHRRDRVFIVGYTKHDGSHGTEIGRSTDSASHNHPKRTDETGEPSGASGRSGDASLANASGGQCNTGAEVKGILRILSADGPINGDVGGRGAAQSRQNVADSCSTGREECDDAAITDQSEQCSRRGYAGDATLAYSYSGEGDERRRSAQEDVRGCCSIGRNVGRREKSDTLYNLRRSTQPGVGRDAHELSAWLDGGGLNPLDTLKDLIDSYPQPALMGQPQYDWEPTRVATGVKNRTARLKALGNAVDPLQIFPIMYTIKRIDDWLREGRA